MSSVLLSSLPPIDETIAVVERKGAGDPDTIGNALAEMLSRVLNQEYLAHSGEILHRNVDNAQLCADWTTPGFGGGRVYAPLDIHLGGRATAPGWTRPPANQRHRC